MRTMFVGAMTRMLGGDLIAGDPRLNARTICTDSRKLAPGDVFVALRGIRFDGHDFITECVKSGAAGVVAERFTEEQLTAIAEASQFAVRVDDTLAALQRLATRYRQTLEVTCIAVTGSTGKTTAKDMVSAALSAFVQTESTDGSLNNEIGLPLTVLKATDSTEALVVEMGMRGLGQIAELCRIASPDIGVVTNVNDTHIELLGSREQTAQAKSELVEAIPERGGVVLNGDDPLVRQMSQKCRGRVVMVGLSDDCDIRAVDVCSMGADGVRFTAVGPEQVDVRVAVPGIHNVHNALFALGVCHLLGYSMSTAAQRLESLPRSDMRMAIKRTPLGVTVIDDSYNASPASMQAALIALMDIGAGGRTIAVLGDMLELGAASEAAHRRIGTLIATKGPDITLTVGDKARLICEQVREVGGNRFAEALEHNAAVIDRLRMILRPGDTVLVKGSRGMHMEEVVRDLMAFGDTPNRRAQ